MQRSLPAVISVFMFAIFSRMSWNSEMLDPNAFLCLLYLTALPKAIFAIPTQIEPMIILLVFSKAFAYSKPSPSLPTRFPSGTAQSVNLTSAVLELLIPNFGMSPPKCRP